ncbi:MAG: hypothetical protein KAZ88_14795 [Acidimicrobiia bacterium]|nr:hypothetical protein [Acidimicrobiia bacterium]
MMMKKLVAGALLTGSLLGPSAAGALTWSPKCFWDNGDKTFDVVIDYTATGTETYPIPAENAMSPGGDGMGDMGQPTTFTGSGQFVVTATDPAVTWFIGKEKITAATKETCITKPANMLGSASPVAGIAAVAVAGAGAVAVAKRRSVSEV